MEITLADLAQRLGAQLVGDGTAVVRGLAAIREAGPDQITFLSNPKYAPDVAHTRAAAIIVPASFNQDLPIPQLRVASPDAAVLEIACSFAPPPPRPDPGVHPSAVVSAQATIGADVRIGPHCVIQDGAVIGDRTAIGAGSYVGHETSIGADGFLHPHVTVRERVRIGSRAILHSGAVIGSDGFGYLPQPDGAWRKIPQVGIVVIGDDVEIGANVTIDRARFGETRIGNGVKIDNLVQIAHNVRLGDHTAIAAQAGISGSTAVGSHVQIAGQAGLVGHIEIGDGCVLGAQSGVSKSVPPKTFVLGSPAVDAHEAKRTFAAIARLPALKKRLADLETRIAHIEAVSAAQPQPEPPPPCT